MSMTSAAVALRPHSLPPSRNFLIFCMRLQGACENKGAEGNARLSRLFEFFTLLEWSVLRMDDEECA
jgi:hypothetical protein